MHFDLTQLESDAIHVHEALDAADLDGSDPDARFKPVRATVDFWLKRERGGARLTGSFSATIQSECDRCLKPLDIDLAGDVDQRYTWGDLPAEPDEDVEVEATEMDIERLESTTLDTKQVALEQIELNAPVRVVCSESCAGLCPVCGADRNTTDCGCSETQTDPRWEALRKLK